MRRAASLKIFVLGLFAGVVLLTLLWIRVSPWTSYPVGMVAGAVLEHAAPGWVRETRLRPGAFEVDTSVAVATPQTGNRLVEITVESDPGRYAYGLPIFLALLLAARGPGRTWRALAGFALLVPLQAFSLVMHLLMQVVLTAQLDVRVLKVAQWQLEALVYGYQVGVLVLPTLAPMVLWLWLDRQFVNEVVIEAWRRSLPAARAAAPVPAAAAVASPQPAADAVAEPADAIPEPIPHVPPGLGGKVSASAAATLPVRKKPR
ncbi:hypothetical protein AVME950_23160 [Acidovorax sp. SUPP950]|uniref:exosortase H-associated membrane protein n=1 Tax=Acidovorax sp. SUPP950 TaxID=511901 RepID=UPI0023C5974F|nr:exosortase H-associated membrane protein [Acidovorax sp. SUPP950]GKS77850.1 hypothetical protein AVME950_23160 [Acidovorax sp. SUPP950]